MAYRLKLREKPGQSLRRIIDEQLSGCLGQIADDEPDIVKGIHETRKSLKRIRAMLRLMRSGLGEDAFKAENARYRQIARLLGGHRDRHILISTLDYLQERGIRGDKRQFALVRLAAEAIGGPAGDRQDLKAILAKVRRSLAKARREAERLSLEPDTFDVVADGLERTMRRCREATRLAETSEQADDWHNWRKSVQQHWRQMRLMEAAWPDYFNARAALASQLADMLGRAQDLDVLQKFLESTACTAVAGEVRYDLQACAAQQILQLRELALPLGRQLLAEEPAGLRRRSEFYYRTALEIKRIERAQQKRANSTKRRSAS